MENHIRFQGGGKPPTTGFATPKVATLPKNETDEAVNDSLGSVHPADTMDTDPKNARKTGGREAKAEA